jgi:hypothetical protein
VRRGAWSREARCGHDIDERVQVRPDTAICRGVHARCKHRDGGGPLHGCRVAAHSGRGRYGDSRVYQPHIIEHSTAGSAAVPASTGVNAGLRVSPSTGFSGGAGGSATNACAGSSGQAANSPAGGETCTVLNPGTDRSALSCGAGTGGGGGLGVSGGVSGGASPAHPAAPANTTTTTSTITVTTATGISPKGGSPGGPSCGADASCGLGPFGP